MTDKTEAGQDAAADEAGRSWRPSRPPEHRGGPSPAERPRIVEQTRRATLLRSLQAWIANPIVKVVIGVSLFITAALTYDATVNGGAWTERQGKVETTRDKSGRRIPAPR